MPRSGTWPGDCRGCGIGAGRADPKDKAASWNPTARRSGTRWFGRWQQAIELLQGILREQPGMIDVWASSRPRRRSREFEQDLDAHRKVMALEPTDPSGYLGGLDHAAAAATAG